MIRDIRRAVRCMNRARQREGRWKYQGEREKGRASGWVNQERGTRGS